MMRAARVSIVASPYRLVPTGYNVVDEVTLLCNATCNDNNVLCLTPCLLCACHPCSWTRLILSAPFGIKL